MRIPTIDISSPAIRLGLRPLMSVFVWLILAATGWFLCGIISRSLPSPFPISPDNQRYFFSATAQAIGAIGALVFVASFAAIQTTAARGVSTGIVTFITCDPLFHATIAFVIAGIIIPLGCTLVVPPEQWPLGFNAPGATLFLMLCALSAVVTYALAIPRHSSPDRTLTSMLDRIPLIADETAPKAVEIIEGTIEGYMIEFVRALGLRDAWGSRTAIVRLASTTECLCSQRSPSRYAELIQRAWRVCSAQVLMSCTDSDAISGNYHNIVKELSGLSFAVFRRGSIRGVDWLQSLLTEIVLAGAQRGYADSYSDYWRCIQHDLVTTALLLEDDPQATKQLSLRLQAYLRGAQRLLTVEADKVASAWGCDRLRGLWNTFAEYRYDQDPSASSPVDGPLKAHVGAMLAGFGGGLMLSRPSLLREFAEAFRNRLEDGLYQPELLQALRVAVAGDGDAYLYCDVAASSLESDGEAISKQQRPDRSVALEAFYHVLCMSVQGWLCQADNRALARELADVPLHAEHARFIETIWEAHWPSEDMHKQLRHYGMYLRSMKAKSG